MQKPAAEVLQQGLQSRDRTTKAACIKSLSLMKDQKPTPAGKPPTAKRSVKDIKPTGRARAPKQQRQKD